MTGRLGRALGMSPLALARRLASGTRIRAEDGARRKADLYSSTYSSEAHGSLRRIIPDLPVLNARTFESRAVKNYCQHYFDLLGSGWTRVRYGMPCVGLGGIVFEPSVREISGPDTERLRELVNEPNLTEAKRLWSLLPSEYQPIDWQLDFKSGYRWEGRTWYRDIRFGQQRGADVKVPWELSRMQHLPQLALEYGRTRSGETLLEFRNQVIDWLATNPPRYGVNWNSTMDVAIRSANMVLANDLFLAYAAEFDQEFQSVFQRSVREHAVHILENLEWSETLRANHYLANIAGLAFCSVYLPRSEETDSWLAFADAELTVAVGEQFYEDGSSFEASTSYHRLSSEMIVYAAAILAREPDRLPARGVKSFTDRTEHIRKMAAFSRLVTKPNGNVWQVGDNDSGRFFKVAPAFSGDGEDDFWENHLDHSHLEQSVGTLLGDEPLAGDADSVVIASLRGSSAGHPSNPRPNPFADVTINAQESSTRPPPASQRVRSIDIPELVPADIRSVASVSFGVFVFESPGFYLGIRCGSVGQNGIGGHAHNDQLAIELNVNGEDWIADPGTYLYTPLPEMRNAYRDADAHSSPRAAGFEQGRLAAGLFRLGDACVAQCVAFEGGRFIGEMRKGSKVIRREVALTPGRITVTDTSWGCDLLPPVSSTLRFSPGYGMLADSPRT